MLISLLVSLKSTNPPLYFTLKRLKYDLPLKAEFLNITSDVSSLILIDSLEQQLFEKSSAPAKRNGNKLLFLERLPTSWYR